MSDCACDGASTIITVPASTALPSGHRWRARPATTPRTRAAAGTAP